MKQDFEDWVDFSLELNEWAASQPGYKSPVTEADVEEVMAKIRPILKPKPRSSQLAKLITVTLVKIIEKESAKPNTPALIEVPTDQNQIQAELLNEMLQKKLVEMEGSGIKVTSLGRRFVQDNEQLKNE